MNNEEILKAVSEQKNKNDEFENKIQSRGAMLASGIGLIMAVIMVFAESSIFHKMDLGKPAIIFMIIFVSDLFEGIKFKSKKKIIFAVISGLLLVTCLIGYIGALIG